MLEFNTWVIVFVPTIMVLLIILAAVVLWRRFASGYWKELWRQPFNNFEARVSEWEALWGFGGGLPLATISAGTWRADGCPTIAQCEPNQSVASHNQEFGSGILISILREQRGGGTCDRLAWRVVPPPLTISTAFPSADGLPVE